MTPPCCWIFSTVAGPSKMNNVDSSKPQIKIDPTELPPSWQASILPCRLQSISESKENTDGHQQSRLSSCLGRMNTNHGSPNHFKQCCGEFPNRWGSRGNEIDYLGILDSQCDLPTTVLETNAALGPKSSTPAQKNAALMVLSMLSAPVNHFSIDAFLLDYILKQ